MSADHPEHTTTEETPHTHAFDSPEEVAHAQQHAVQNIWFFVGFFTLVLLAVANYELFGVDYWWAVLALAAVRSLFIALFLSWLFSHFSLVFRTLFFTLIFLCGMIFLSLWDSKLHNFIGNPIALPSYYQKASHSESP